MDVQPSRSDPLGPLRPALATGCNGGCLDETSGWAKGFGWKVKLVVAIFCLVVWLFVVLLCSTMFCYVLYTMLY